MQVRNAWYVVGWEKDLAGGKPFGTRILDEPIVVWRASTGAVIALDDRCSHRSAPLSMGRCEGDRIRCTYHGLLYNTEGRCVEIPGQSVIPPAARVRKYPAVVRHSWIWVWMGDAATADPALIPPAVGFDDPDYLLGSGQLDYAAPAELIHNNLLDFSHLSFVHTESFRATATWAANQPKVTVLPRGVRIERWLPNEPGLYDANPVDNWSSYDYLVPGILLMGSGPYAAGTAQASGFGPPVGATPLSLAFTSQAVTPTTPHTSRYFFMWGPHRRYGNEDARDALMSAAMQAFAEDRAVIEGQARVGGAAALNSRVATAADRGVTLYTRLVERLVREESAVAEEGRGQGLSVE